MINQAKENSSGSFSYIPQPVNQSDIMTPHKLSVVFLIQEYLQVKKGLGETISPKYKRQFCNLLLKLIQFPDMSYKDLYQYLTSPTYGIMKKHLDGFEGLMKLLTQIGIEVLFDVQTLMDKLMSDNAATNGGVSSYGIVGLYLRRVHVTLDKMSFPELMALYKNILTYYDKGVRSIAISPDLKLGNDQPVDTQLFYKDRAGTYSKWSIKQSELFVAQQSTLLISNETEALDPIEMENRLKEIVTDNPMYSQAHFLSYMNNLRIRDFQNSLDALHRSFDRRTVKTAATTQEPKGYQYSSLNLAILHALFNHKAEALASLKECIMLAQEAGDRVCLQIAQSWLCYLDTAQIQLNEKMVANKTELSLVNSVSLGIQFVVKQASQAGYLPSKLFELLLKSDILNCQHSMMNLIGNCLAEKTAIWSLYGKNDIASLFSQILLNSNLKTLGKANNGEGNCHALCCLGLWLSLQGEYTLSAVVIQHAKERFPRPPISRFWAICECVSISTHAIYRHRWKEGNDVITSLFTLDEKVATLQLASLNIARGNFSYARDILQRLLATTDLEHFYRVRAMILLANTYITPDQTSPHVINILNKALHLATEKYLDYEAALIQMTSAHVLLGMNMPRQALKVMKESVEIILANGSLYDRAKCNFLLVKCLVASTTTNDDADKLKCMAGCMKLLDESIDAFTKLECYTKVKDIYFYVATFYADMNIVNQRNWYSHKFRKCDEQFATSYEYLNVFY